MNKENEEKVKTYALNGLSAKEIAIKLNYKDTTEIYRVLRKQGIKITGKNPSRNASRNAEIRTLYVEGWTTSTLAEKYGLSTSSIRNICEGLIKHPKATLGIELIKEGYTAKEITEICGYSRVDSVYTLAKSHGLKVQKANARIYEQMRQYKAEGHSMREVAEKFGVCEATALKACKGIAPQKAPVFGEDNPPPNKGVLQDVDNVLEMISERAPGFEYAGNYTGSAGHVDLRCKKCGYVHTHGWHGLRHKGVKVCPNCLRIEREQRRAEIAEQKAKEKRERQEKREQKQEQKKREAEARRIARIHLCPVCGAITARKTYCSDECQKKAWNARHEAKRRVKLQDAMVDKDITLERLYHRDTGVCHICNGQCDWNDYKREGVFFIVGKDYPTIDHVLPLAMGGKHSWENVKLAHHSCNSAKGARTCG